MALVLPKGSIDAQLPVDIFDVQVNIPLIHQVVVAQLAAARQGTHSTKSRGEVSARRAPVALVRARSAHPSTTVVASCTARRRVRTTSARPRR
jgi:hypothetical protein